MFKVRVLYGYPRFQQYFRYIIVARFIGLETEIPRKSTEVLQITDMFYHINLSQVHHNNLWRKKNFLNVHPLFSIPYCIGMQTYFALNWKLFYFYFILKIGYSRIILETIKIAPGVYDNETKVQSTVLNNSTAYKTYKCFISIRDKT